MRKWIRRSIVNRYLVIYLAATLSTALIVSLSAYDLAYKVVYDASIQLMDDELNLTETALESRYKELNQMCSQIMFTPDIHDKLRMNADGNVVRQYLDSEYIYDAIYQATLTADFPPQCIYYGLNGIKGSVSSNNSIPMAIVPLQETLCMAAQNALSYTALPEKARGLRGHVLIGRQIRDMANELSGYIYFVIGENEILGCMPDSTQRANHVFYLTDRAGNILTTDSKLTEKENKDVLDADSSIVALESGKSLIRYKDLSHGGGRMVLVKPIDEVLFQTKRLRASIMLVGLLIGGFAGLFGVQIINRVRRPLILFQNGIKRIGRGDFTVRFIPNGDDEIATLADCMNRMCKQLEQLILERQQQARVNEKFEMQSRQNQITPHFLLNTLNNIQFMALHNGEADIASMLQSLSAILDVTLRSENMIPLSKELSILNCYVDLQRKNIEKLCLFFVKAPASLPDLRVPALVLQPLVENAIMHGCRDDGMISVVVEAKLDDRGGVWLNVTDDGVGMSADEIQRIMNSKGINTSHIGLMNINRRWQLAFGEEYGIIVESEKGKGCRVSMYIPPKVEGNS